MSMLAERRRKTKWVINPTKKPLWTTESNGIKFGKELMEKMGWSAGKGLGAKEQGIQEPLKVSYKNDTKGMGFKGNDDDWIEQQDEFNVLLNQLRNSDDSSVVKVSEEEKNEIKSLEEKSKQSRARVHYQKFTRGKDLSRYSENDLACILGTNKIKKEKLKTEEVVESEEKNDGGLVTSFGVTTINSGSIQDYFKKKWIIDKVQSKNVEREKGEHSYDERPSFSRVFQESEEFSVEEYKNEDGALDGNEINGDTADKCDKRKKRKKDVQTSEAEEPKSKRKKTSDQDNPVDEGLHNLAGIASNEVENENLLGCENNCDSARKRKKEKRKSKKDEGLDGTEDADGFEVKKKKKKERKEKPVENGYCDAVIAFNDCNLKTECPMREEEFVKKKKKGKTESEVFDEAKKENVEPDLEVGLEKINDVVEGGDVMIAKRKKKKKYKDCNKSARADEPNKGNELGKVDKDVCEGDTELGSKKKKKKKEKKDDKMESCSSENGIFCEIQVEKCGSGSNSNSITDSEVKEKKKKKEKPEGDIVELHRNESGFSTYAKCDGENNCSSAMELKEVKKKKKKKKEKQEGGKLECSSTGNEISNEVQMEKCDNGSNSNSTAELEEMKKKRKKKEKQEGDSVECSSKGNEICSEIPLEKCDGRKRTPELEEVKKKKKKDKHKTKEEDPDSNHMKKSCLDEAHQEGINGFSETVQKKKKKKDKKEKQKSKDEAFMNEEEESKDQQSLNGEKGSDMKRKKKKSSEIEESKKEGGEKEPKAVEKLKGNEGNAEIGTTAGIDKVELISQRAAYEHVAGQHRYERVKKMIEFVNLSRFRGSNLECLDGYGNSLRKCEPSAR